jgi:hypothetical protein
MKTLRTFCALLLALTAAFSAPQSNPARTAAVLEPPGAGSYPQIGDNSALLVNGRKVTPAGQFIKVQS